MLSKMAPPPVDLHADLTKCKLPELKNIARFLKLRVSGTKSELINLHKLFWGYEELT